MQSAMSATTIHGDGLLFIPLPFIAPLSSIELSSLTATLWHLQASPAPRPGACTWPSRPDTPDYADPRFRARQIPRGPLHSLMHFRFSLPSGRRRTPLGAPVREWLAVALQVKPVL